MGEKGQPREGVIEEFPQPGEKGRELESTAASSSASKPKADKATKPRPRRR